MTFAKRNASDVVLLKFQSTLYAILADELMMYGARQYPDIQQAGKQKCFILVHFNNMEHGHADNR